MVKIRDLDYEIVAKGVSFYYENNNEIYKHLEKNQVYLLLREGQFYYYFNNELLKEDIINIDIGYTSRESLLDYHCIIINTKYKGQIEVNHILYNIIKDKEDKMLLIKNGIFYLFFWNELLKSWHLYELKGVKLKFY